MSPLRLLIFSLKLDSVSKVFLSLVHILSVSPDFDIFIKGAKGVNVISTVFVLVVLVNFEANSRNVLPFHAFLIVNVRHFVRIELTSKFEDTTAALAYVATCLTILRDHFFKLWTELGRPFIHD